MFIRLTRASRCCFFIAFGIAALGVCVAVLSLYVPNEWIGCETEYDCDARHAAVARSICFKTITLALWFIIFGGAIGIFLEIKNKYGPDFQAVQVTAKTQWDRDDRIREKAREILMASTDLPAATHHNFFNYDSIPQEFIDLATAQLENVSP